MPRISLNNRTSRASTSSGVATQQISQKFYKKYVQQQERNKNTKRSSRSPKKRKKIKRNLSPIESESGEQRKEDLEAWREVYGYHRSKTKTFDDKVEGLARAPYKIEVQDSPIFSSPSSPNSEVVFELERDRRSESVSSMTSTTSSENARKTEQKETKSKSIRSIFQIIFGSIAMLFLVMFVNDDLLLIMFSCICMFAISIGISHLASVAVNQSLEDDAKQKLSKRFKSRGKNYHNHSEANNKRSMNQDHDVPVLLAYDNILHKQAITHLEGIEEIRQNNLKKHREKLELENGPRQGSLKFLLTSMARKNRENKNTFQKLASKTSTEDSIEVVKKGKRMSFGNTLVGMISEVGSNLGLKRSTSISHSIEFDRADSDLISSVDMRSPNSLRRVTSFSPGPLPWVGEILHF